MSHIFKINHFLSLSSGLWDNPKLLIGKSSPIWKEWVIKGISTLGDLYKDGVLQSFENLVEQFKIDNQFWRYLQLRHFLATTFGSNHTTPGHGPH